MHSCACGSGPGGIRREDEEELPAERGDRLQGLWLPCSENESEEG